MIAVSAAVVALGMATWVGSSRQPLQTRTGSPALDLPMADDELPPPDQAMLSVPRDDTNESSSYAQVRRSLNAGRLPPREAVRIGEMVNHFSYRATEPPPNSRAQVSVQLEIAAAPWQPEHRLVRIHLKGRERRGHATAAAGAQNLTVALNFNSSLVAAYRAIGRDPAPTEPPTSPTPEAREISAADATTELYEIIPAGSPVPSNAIFNVGWRRPEAAVDGVGQSDDLLTVTGELGAASRAKTWPREHFTLKDDGRRFEAAGPDFKFAAAVAAFGMMLRDWPEGKSLSPALIVAWSQAGRGDDPGAQRAEFTELVRRAQVVLAAAKTGSS